MNKIPEIISQKLNPRVFHQQKLFLRSFLHGAHKWNISKACEAAGISRRVAMSWGDRYPYFTEIMEEVYAKKQDYGEERLVTLMKERGMPGVTATIFFNKTINRDRGYEENPQVQINNTLNAILPKDQIDKLVNIEQPKLKRIENTHTTDA